MLSTQDNELLTRVGPGTPMGSLLRQYWLPALLSSELGERDGSPLRVRLLGEDLVAFRDTNGDVGLIQNNCPHRGASLFFGRNEEAGLRCVYHGWKFDTNGRRVDTPDEPAHPVRPGAAEDDIPTEGAEADFRSEARAVTYPCVERGGAIWAYMGPLDPPPPLSQLEWIDVPDSHRFLAKRVQFCNWVQALEGEVDQSHVSFLHRRLDGRGPDGQVGRGVDRIRTRDTHPRFAAVDTDYGVLIGAARQAPDNLEYWRLTQFLLPFWTMTGPYGENPSRQTPPCRRAWALSTTGRRSTWVPATWA